MQLSLLDASARSRRRPSPTPEAARRTDPETSHLAARRMSSSSHDGAVLQALQELGTATYRELSLAAGLREPVQAQRALTRLSYRGLVRKTGDRRQCRTNGSLMQLWEVSA